MLKKLIFKPGINREVTNYTNEGGWYDGDKIRFRAGFPEKIGGWVQQSANRFLGACRSLFSWTTLSGAKQTGVGTHLKFYIESGNVFYDVTPPRDTSTVTFAATSGEALVTVTDSSSHGAATGDYVSFSGAISLSSQTFTVNGSSPYITVATTALANNDPVTVSTTGSLPSPLAANTTYYVRDVAGTSLNLAATLGGAAIVITGGSGTHSIELNQVTDSRTFTASSATDKLSFTGTLVDNSVLRVSSTGTLPAPLQANTDYYVINAAAGECKLSLTVGGSAINLTSTGSGTHTLTRTFGITAAELNRNSGYQITVTSSTEFTIEMSANAVAEDVGDGGSTAVSYDIAPGAEIDTPFTGWSAGGWSANGWGVGEGSTELLRLWHQANFGEDLIIGFRGGELYYWDATSGLDTHAVAISTMGGASGVPTKHNYMLVSDVSRFVFCFGSNPVGSGVLDPMLVRWSDQESYLEWTPAATNQAGEVRLSIGSEIITATQQRQEILVWTDAALYSIQFLGYPYVWGTQLVGENITIMSPNAVASAGNITYWMGIDKFYVYDGRVRPLRCDIRQYIFQNTDPTKTIDLSQAGQVFAGTVEQFDEIWWFYCSSPTSETLTSPDRYAVYNYAQDIWYYGELERSAWLDSRISDVPLAAYRDRLILQETGVDDATNGSVQPLPAYISSSEIDIADGDNFMLVTRVIPDMTFRGSTDNVPSADLTLIPMKNPGSGYQSPASIGGTDVAPVTRSATTPIEQFSGQVYVRVRGRQLIVKVSSSNAGTTWQLGSPRFDMRADGRR